MPVGKPTDDRADLPPDLQSVGVPGVHQMASQQRRERPEFDGLARRAAAGDMAAFDELLALIDADGAIRIPVRQLLTDAQSVQDVCQDVLIIVAERIGTWDGHSSFRAWLQTVARNKATDHLRASRPTAVLPDLASDQQRISSLIATRVEVNKALAQLPDHYRDAVVLRDIDQREYDDIAMLLEVPAATVRSRVRRGRAMVAARWIRSHQ